eukprot:gene8259-5779_t
MGGLVNSSAKGFHGFFRQQWQDFHVTEMVADPNEPCGGRCLPRKYDFSLPPLPPEYSILGEEYRDPKGDLHESPDQSFFTVDVQQRLTSLCADDRKDSGIPSVEDSSSHSPLDKRKKICSNPVVENEEKKHNFLQCILHKQHMAHSTAMSLLSQMLRLHPKAITSAGMKDFIGDTVQRVRLEDVSPTSVKKANDLFHSKGHRLTLSHFSYETGPLLPGDLFGNRFKIVLRGVKEEKSVIQDAVTSFTKYGFPNYYGCQRFSWFGGLSDAAFALLLHNPLVFAFRFLNYTDKSRSLRELLQRPLKYPHANQDQYRRRVVSRLRSFSIEPSDLDEAPFLSCPSLSDEYSGESDALNTKKKLILGVLWDSFLDLGTQSRRPIAQRLSSYLWNQVLTLRLHHFGGSRVLEGDQCVPWELRRLTSVAGERTAVNKSSKFIATSEMLDDISIQDVVHPGFSFENIALPENAVGDFYLQVCEKYHLDWATRHSKGGLSDFMEPPRPIVRLPLDLKYTYQPELEQLTLQFSLERGCYANVAVTELMKLGRCAGSEKIITLPLCDTYWESMGSPDPGYVTPIQEIYSDYEDGFGFTRDTVEVDVAPETEDKIWNHSGPFFLPPWEDPYRRAAKWGREHLLRPMQRRELDVAKEKRRLFEGPLARTIRDDEVPSYAGHTVPLAPNANSRRVRKALFRRRQRYPGAPRSSPTFDRRIITKGKRRNGAATKALPEYYKLNRNTWNVAW